MIAKIIKKAVLGAVFVFATTVFAAPSSREVREYECDYPDENEQSFLQDAVPRYVLDHATSAAHTIELLEERNLVGDLLGEFSFHFLIADRDA